MTDNRCECAASSCFKEAICIDAGRVYDSCCDKDCIEDTRIYFTECGQNLIENAVTIRGKSVKIIKCYIDVEPVPFNQGYYSIDMTFYFKVKVEVSSSPSARPETITGLSVFNKKVILFGGEGNVKVFSSELSVDENDMQLKPARNVPRAIVQCAEPILLCANICKERVCDRCENAVPRSVCGCFDGELSMCDCEKVALATIGLFTIVQLERQVQMAIPVYDFCTPCKECVTSCDDPCELFSKIKFPSDQFFPTRSQSVTDATPCGKSQQQNGCPRK